MSSRPVGGESRENASVPPRSPSNQLSRQHASHVILELRRVAQSDLSVDRKAASVSYTWKWRALSGSSKKKLNNSKLSTSVLWIYEILLRAEIGLRYQIGTYHGHKDQVIACIVRD